MAIFKKLNRFVETHDEKQYENEMREALENGSQKKPNNQAPDYTHVEELSSWSGYGQNKAILEYLEEYPDRCWKYLDQSDELNNNLNSGPWCIERLSETDLGFEGPKAGLTHVVFYNQKKVGTINLRPTTVLPDSIEDDIENYKGVIVEIKIEGVLLIKADHVASLINVAVIPVNDFESKLFTEDWRFMYQRAIQQAIHNSIAHQSLTGSLDFYFNGAVQRARPAIENQ